MNVHSGQYIGTPLTLVWSLSRRLEDLQLKVPVAYLQPLVGLPDHMFPALRSLDIHIQDANLHALPRFVGIITAFAGAPCLRSLKLAGSVEVMHLFSCQFPWAQLTSLRLNCGDGPSITRSIVSQCVNLETCSITLYDSIMSEDALPIVNSVLPNLRTLSYDGPGEDGDEDQEDYSPEFFKSLSFPQLQVLSMDTSPWSAEVLVELHQRSTFELTTLTLGRLNLSSDEVVEFFSLIPTLKGLILNHGRGLHDDLFAALTYSNAHPHTAILPELEALTIKTGPSSSDWIEDPVAVAILDGSVVVAMLESRWWPDPAPGPSNPSAPRPAISRLKQTTLQFTHDSFMNFDQRVKAKLDVMVSEGMLNYYWVV
jgi:hypothetical protein